MKKSIKTYLIYRLLFLFFAFDSLAYADDLSEDKKVKLLTEYKYEFHNQFGEYLEILQNQIRTNFDKNGPLYVMSGTSKVNPSSFLTGPINRYLRFSRSG